MKPPRESAEDAEIYVNSIFLHCNTTFSLRQILLRGERWASMTRMLVNRGFIENTHPEQPKRYPKQYRLLASEKRLRDWVEGLKAGVDVRLQDDICEHRHDTKPNWHPVSRVHDKRDRCHQNTR